MQTPIDLPWSFCAHGAWNFFAFFLLSTIPCHGKFLSLSIITLPISAEIENSPTLNFINKFLFDNSNFTINITTQPSSQSVCVGDDMSISVTANSSVTGGMLTYQWQEKQENQGSGFSNILDATNATYLINNIISTQNNYAYQAIISDDNGTPNTSDDVMITSDVAILTVISTTCEAMPWSGNN